MSSPESLREIKQIVFVVALTVVIIIVVIVVGVLFWNYSMAELMLRPTESEETSRPASTRPLDSTTLPETTTEPSAEVSTCRCDEDVNRYDCTDFANHSKAQACYDKCMEEIDFDLHFLDDDDDGIACEGLVEE